MKKLLAILAFCLAPALALAHRATTQTVGATTATVDGVTPADGKIAVIQAQCLGIRSDRGAGGYYRRIGFFSRSGATSVQIGTTDTFDREAAAIALADVAFVINGPEVNVQTTGVAAVTINWTCDTRVLIMEE